jgi:hypothetical protein
MSVQEREYKEYCGKAIATKMLAIMNEVQYIQKTGHNKFHNYKYAKESDISEAFSKALIKHKVFMFSSIVDYGCKAYETKKGEHRFLVTTKLNVKFVDADSGESFESVFYGDGADSDDKGVYKAITGAQKYALLKTFMVSTGDDPEQDDHRNEENKENNMKGYDQIIKVGREILDKDENIAKARDLQRLHELIMQCKEPAVTRDSICAKADVESLTELTQVDVRRWISFLEDKLGDS